MGYSTNFYGAWIITPAPHPKIALFVNNLSHSRRVKRDLPEGLYGKEGEFYVDGKGYAGQDKDESVIDSNTPPKTQPGLWCQWIIEGDKVKWDGNEKFYEYLQWIDYLIRTVFEPNGYKLNGTVKWEGESGDDTGTITIKDNKIDVGGGD
jgi:hypothetical protein